MSRPVSFPTTFDAVSSPLPIRRGIRPPEPWPRVVRVPVPAHPPVNLFEARPLILLSQGEVRPGMVQGQHWGHRLRVTGPPPPPLLDFDMNVSIR